MFDFSWTGILWAFASLLWAAMSPVALKQIGAAVAIALIGLFLLPRRLRLVALAAAAGLGAFAFCWQAAEADGARRMLMHDHAVAIRAEQLRAEKAEAITHEAIELRAHEQVERQADTLKIKELTDALAKDPRRDGVCLPRLWSQRLRRL
ncbi:hypothetical protein MKK84_27085 [Methylobacterium sp. E-065]|uniref:hypothetical protein n=1 Tax=Methylobacterium sp. E-065 TaxID=2836583 RepID=UPI001FBAE037|nr:hypothetical protein [Methylobacterium sp. E-065]MCJ2021043.1 hypothetical protein [Methylobacterium sp. E-065]